MTTNDTPMTREQLLELLKSAYSVGYSHANQRNNEGFRADETWRDDIMPRLEGGRFYESWPLDFTTIEGWDTAY